MLCCATTDAMTMQLLMSVDACNTRGTLKYAGTECNSDATWWQTAIRWCNLMTNCSRMMQLMHADVYIGTTKMVLLAKWGKKRRSISSPPLSPILWKSFFLVKEKFLSRQKWPTFFLAPFNGRLPSFCLFLVKRVNYFLKKENPSCRQSALSFPKNIDAIQECGSKRKTANYLTWKTWKMERDKQPRRREALLPKTILWRGKSFLDNPSIGLIKIH